MNRFDRTVVSTAGELLAGLDLSVLQVNVGLRCNQVCRHCQHESSPGRIEAMSWQSMERVVGAARSIGRPLVDITGGAPELHPELTRFVAALRREHIPVQVRTNLTALLEPGLEGLAGFFRDHRVQLFASIPCFLDGDASHQRGVGVLERSAEVLRRLNALGYGLDPELPLSLVYNPGEAEALPDQALLEAGCRRELGDRLGIRFTRLLANVNVPVGRFRSELSRTGRLEEYQAMLERSFNPQTLDGLQCRHQISVRWDGTLHDCDFNMAVGLPVDHGASARLEDFDPSLLERRRIVTGAHCFACTAGAGGS